MESLIDATEKKVFKQTVSSHSKGGRTVAPKTTTAALTKRLHQTRPDPLGRRIEPVIDPELIKKTEALVSRDAKRKIAAGAANGANQIAKEGILSVYL